MKRRHLQWSRLDCISDWEALAQHAAYRVSVLAKDCRVSERQLARFFWHRKGKSTRSWLAEQQLARGAASLGRAMLVKEAAAEAGFRHPADFIRKFIKYYGVSPTAFRAGLPT